MRHALRIALLAASLAAAAPAAAQYTFTKPGDPLVPSPDRHGLTSVLRVNVGVGFYNSGWYDCVGYYGYACASGPYTSFVPVLVGPQLDFNVGGVSNVSIGFTAGMGNVNVSYWNGSQTVNASKYVTLWEPTADYVLKFGPPTQETVARMRLGGGLYIGPESKIGGTFRIGGGASFFNASRVGIGLDVVLEAGGFNGAWIGGLQLLVSPELHF